MIDRRWRLHLTTLDREALGPERTGQLTRAIRMIEEDRLSLETALREIVKVEHTHGAITTAQLIAIRALDDTPPARQERATVLPLRDARLTEEQKRNAAREVTLDDAAEGMFQPIVLSAEEFATVMEMIDRPAAPTEALKALFRKSDDNSSSQTSKEPK